MRKRPWLALATALLLAACGSTTPPSPTFLQAHPAEATQTAVAFNRGSPPSVAPTGTTPLLSIPTTALQVQPTPTATLIVAINVVTPTMRATPTLTQSEPIAPTRTPTAPFARYTAADVIAALQPLGITGVKQAARDPNSIAPNTSTANQEFTIPAIAPKGGQVLIFASAADLAGMQAWFARFPDLAPYVYVRGNALVQLNSTLAKAEALKYEAAIRGMK